MHVALTTYVGSSAATIKRCTHQCEPVRTLRALQRFDNGVTQCFGNCEETESLSSVRQEMSLANTVFVFSVIV